MQFIPEGKQQKCGWQPLSALRGPTLSCARAVFPAVGSSPVTRGILASTLVASAVLHLRDPNGTLNVTLGEFRQIATFVPVLH